MIGKATWGGVIAALFLFAGGWWVLHDPNAAEFDAVEIGIEGDQEALEDIAAQLRQFVTCRETPTSPECLHPPQPRSATHELETSK